MPFLGGVAKCINPGNVKKQNFLKNLGVLGSI